MKRLLNWKVGLTGLAIVVLVAFRLYEQAPHYRKIKDEQREAAYDMVIVDGLPVVKKIKLKVVAVERDGRPLSVYWLDSQQKPAGRLCEQGDLAGGAELELEPGRYSLCFELAEDPVRARPFKLMYSLYEYR